MSKERARSRADRLAAHQRSVSEKEAAQAVVAARRIKQQRRQLQWRRLRLWEHGATFNRNKERWAALGTLLMCLVLVTYLLTRSVRDVIIVVLICVIASPLLVATIVTRRKS